MDIQLNLKNMHGEVNAIASKSDAHRLLICAALGDKPCKLILNTTSKDIEATVGCLEALGAKITKDGTNILVEPIKASKKNAVLDCSESGSTIRFLIPVAAALGINCIFKGSGRLPERPQTPILEAISKNGITVNNSFPIEINGQLNAGVFELPGNISSQFITGLIFALPLIKNDSEIKITTPLESAPYIDMTIDTVKKFGIEIKKQGNSFFIKGNQKYISPKEITVDGDWSNGAFFVCQGALSEIKINGLNLNSTQGDKAIIDIVENFGADVKEENGKISIKKNQLKGITVDVGNTPDLVPVVAALACFADGTTTITNAARLRIKESDRLKTITELIKSAGGDITEKPDGLIIKGGKELKKSFTTDSFNDHRLVMAASILAFDSVVTIKNAEAVNKSYPDFIKDITSLGGACNVINDR